MKKVRIFMYNTTEPQQSDVIVSPLTTTANSSCNDQRSTRERVRTKPNLFQIACRDAQSREKTTYHVGHYPSCLAFIFSNKKTTRRRAATIFFQQHCVSNDPLPIANCWRLSLSLFSVSRCPLFFELRRHTTISMSLSLFIDFNAASLWSWSVCHRIEFTLSITIIQFNSIQFNSTNQQQKLT